MINIRKQIPWFRKNRDDIDVASPLIVRSEVGKWKYDRKQMASPTRELNIMWDAFDKSFQQDKPITEKASEKVHCCGRERKSPKNMSTIQVKKKYQQREPLIQKRNIGASNSMNLSPLIRSTDDRSNDVTPKMSGKATPDDSTNITPKMSGKKTSRNEKFINDGGVDIISRMSTKKTPRNKKPFSDESTYFTPKIAGTKTPQNKNRMKEVNNFIDEPRSRKKLLIPILKHNTNYSTSKSSHLSNHNTTVRSRSPQSKRSIKDQSISDVTEPGPSNGGSRTSKKYQREETYDVFHSEPKVKTMEIVPRCIRDEDTMDHSLIGQAVAMRLKKEKNQSNNEKQVEDMFELLLNATTASSSDCTSSSSRSSDRSYCSNEKSSTSEKTSVNTHELMPCRDKMKEMMIPREKSKSVESNVIQERTSNPLQEFQERMAEYKMGNINNKESLKSDSEREIVMPKAMKLKSSNGQVNIKKNIHHCENISSLCLLDIDGEALDASSRLKFALILSGFGSSHDSEKEFLASLDRDGAGKMMLESVNDNVTDTTESIHLWKALIPIPEIMAQRNVDISRHFQKFYSSENLQDAGKLHMAILLMNGQFDKTVQYLINVLDSLPQENIRIGITYMNIGSIRLWQGKYVDAVKAFKLAKDEMYGDVSRESKALVLLGMALYGDKKFEEANQVLLRALTMIRTKRQGYGVYCDTHEFVMGKIFNLLGCSFFENHCYKSAVRSFLNALHVYMQDIVDMTSVTSEDAQSVEYLLKMIYDNADWMMKIPQIYVLDTAITFANLGYVLSHRGSHNTLAISCLRQSLKLQMLDNTDIIINHDIMIATLEQLAVLYLECKLFEDAANILNVIIRTNRTKFANTCNYHQAMFRGSVRMCKVAIQLKHSDTDVKKWEKAASYHEKASFDAIRVENMCKKVCTGDYYHGKYEHAEYSDEISNSSTSSCSQSENSSSSSSSRPKSDGSSCASVSLD